MVTFFLHGSSSNSVTVDKINAFWRAKSFAVILRCHATVWNRHKWKVYVAAYLGSKMQYESSRSVRFLKMHFVIVVSDSLAMPAARIKGVFKSTHTRLTVFSWRQNELHITNP
jgi:hypothetical protein